MLPQRQEIASVVVCEDDTVTLELLCDHLVADRFGALPAPSASDALRLCRYNQPDLLLLDLTLPDASGLDVLREIREADGVGSRFDPRLPVIVLTGRGADADRVRGLESGADDYVIKPFHYPELRARIGAVLRRGADKREGPCRVGEIVIDPARRTVTVAQRDVQLSNKEFSLLRALAADPTRVFSKEELLHGVWGYRTLGRTRTLDSHASRLRRKLDPEHSRYVINCWGVGYRLVDG
jgi:DNA-binding response OmpR family regulator